MRAILLARYWSRDMRRRIHAINKQQMKMSVTGYSYCLSSNAMPPCRRFQEVTRCFFFWLGLSIFTVCIVCTRRGCLCVELTAGLLLNLGR